MIIKVLAYRDTKLNVYTEPFYMQDVDNATIIEVTRRMCANPQLPSQYFDYELFLLGKYDDKRCKFELGDPEFLVSLADFKHLAPVKEKVEEKVDVVG